MSARDDIHLLEDDVYLAKYLEIARQKFEEGNKAIILRAMNQWLAMRSGAKGSVGPVRIYTIDRVIERRCA